MVAKIERQRAGAALPSYDDLHQQVQGYLDASQIEELRQAYAFAEEAHRGQSRLTGDPYIVHPLAAAVSCAELKLDLATLKAALLHDVGEDCGVSHQELAEKFGEETARLVDGVTKLGTIPWGDRSEAPGAEAVQAENLRRMFIAMAEDVRVVIVKLADRLHNMRTLEPLPQEKRLAIAEETMEIYAPLASRLGIWQLKWELEDLAFRYLEPDQYRRIAVLVANRRATRERYVEQLRRKLQDTLSAEELQAEVKGRAKNIYSIHQKIKKYSGQGRSAEEIYDLLALRVLVERKEDCYNALGIVHSLWRPIAGEFDDYIGYPKPNGYQSLHTTVYWQETRPLEVQIRTFEMNRDAEYGVAAHWSYKEGGGDRRPDQERVAWLRQLVDSQRDLLGAAEFVETLKADVFQDQVYVFTPKGEVKDLPAGATPLDFAFLIHTEIGYSCVGAKVNGRLVQLSTPLHNGDVVEVLMSRTSRGPSRDWLNPALGFLKTQHARTKVRQAFRRLERDENIARGREQIERELRRLNLKLSEAESDLLGLVSHDSLDDLFQAIGHGDASAYQLALKLANLTLADEIPAGAVPLAQPLPERAATGVHVLGARNVHTRFGNCCSPVPGDPIMGYITRGRGVTVHRSDCHSIVNNTEHERLVEVLWGSAPGAHYASQIRIVGWDRVGLVRDVSTILADEGINMVGLRTDESADGLVTLGMAVETSGFAQLQRVMTKVDAIRGVLSVERER
jgi:guanosine-3',5'-bis(diphosphate) 3'-pyrophosphohydrolase